MNAPDKIVLPAAAGEMQFLIDDTVYIRKDALLEWLQKEYETNKWFYETHAKPNNLHTGRCEAYKKVIDKIESL